MRYRVIQEFATPLHRFPAGTEIDAAEIDGPVPVERWVELGKLTPLEISPSQPLSPEPTSENEPPRRSRFPAS